MGVLLSLSIMPMVIAQAPASAPALELADVAGVQAGMSVDAVLNVAADALQGGSFTDAQKILDAVIAQDRGNVRALSLQASSYERQAQQKKDSGDPAEVEKADAFVQKAIDIYIVLAPLKSKAGEYRDAEQMFTRILLHRPNYAPAQLELARLMDATDRQIAAIDRYREYLRNPAARPESLTEVNIELGRLYRRAKMLSQAITMLLAAQKLNPEHPEVHIELALTYSANSTWDKARVSAEKAIQRAPENSRCYDILATVLLAQGDIENAHLRSRQAIQLAQTQLSRESDNQELWRSLYGYYRTMEQILRTILNKDNITAARVDLVRIMQQRSSVLEILEGYQQLDILRAAPEADKGNARLLETMAELEISLSKWDDAAATSRRLLEVEPQNAVAERVLQDLSSRQSQSATTQSVDKGAAGAP